jgi:hypothetical protein
MIAILLFLLLLATPAMGQRSWDPWPPVVASSTNVDDSVLRLEFADSKVVAGDRLFGRMVVSNASSEFRQLIYNMTKRRDSYIGDFVVVDDEGNQIQKKIWSSLEAEGLWSKGRIAFLWPSNYARFNADLVRQYSLTNPGTYFVKAVAQVPRPEGERDEVVVETPPVEITVLPRPEGAPPPEPLYTATELARIPKNEAPPQLQVTPPRSRTKSLSPDVRPNRGIVPPGAIPNVHESSPVTAPERNASIDTSPANSPPARSRMRTVAYACVVIVGLAVLGGILWRSRRSHS